MSSPRSDRPPADGIFIPLPIDIKPVISDPDTHPPMSLTSPPRPPAAGLKRCLRTICGATKTRQWGTSPDGAGTICQRCYALYLNYKLPLFQHPVSGRLSIINFEQAIPVRVTGFALRPTPQNNRSRKPSRDALKPFVVPLQDTALDRALLRMTETPSKARAYRSKARMRNMANSKRKFTGQPGTRVEFAQAMRRKKLRTAQNEGPILVLTDDSNDDRRPESDEDKSSASGRYARPTSHIGMPNQIQPANAEVIGTGLGVPDVDDDDVDDGWISVPPNPARQRQFHRPDPAIARPSVLRRKRSIRTPQVNRSRVSVTERLFRNAMLRNMASEGQESLNKQKRFPRVEIPPMRKQRKKSTLPSQEISALVSPHNPTSPKRTPQSTLPPEAAGTAERSNVRQSASPARPQGQPPACPVLKSSSIVLPPKSCSPPRLSSRSSPFQPISRPTTPPFPGPESASTLIGVKAEFRGDIRRLRIGNESSLVSFIDELRGLFALRSTFTVKYRDEESDFVTIANEKDMREMVYMVREHRLVPLRVQVEPEEVQHEWRKESTA